MFRAMVAYLVGAWLLLQIANVTFPPLGLPEWMQRALIIALAVGIVPAFVLAWLFDLTTSGVVRTPPRNSSDAAPGSKAGGANLRMIAGTVARPGDALSAEGVATPDPLPASPASSDTTVEDPSIAILPFADLSPDKDQDWFCDGLAEEIIDALCCVRNLRVASRTASFRYRDGSVDPREIGRELRVRTILEGSVRKAGERLRITAQLIDAVSGFHLWSETYDRRLEDVFAIQSEIARKVSAELRVSLTGEQAARLERYAPRNVQAHEFYLRGRQLVAQVGFDEWRQAPAMFRRAIEIDPEYAQAHAGLADILAQLTLWRFLRPGEDVMPEATRAAYRALELAPDLAEAHVAVGHVRSLAGDAAGASRSFERALELNPDLFDAHYYFARHCFAHGEYERAAELFRSAFALHPDDYAVLALAVSVYDRLGEKARGEVLAREAAAGLLHQVELDPSDARANYFLAGMLARLGRREEGIPYVEAALRLRPNDYSTLYNAACYYSLAGDSERAIDLLEKACESGGGSRGWFEHDQDLEPLRANVRFKALMARLADDPAASPAAR